MVSMDQWSPNPAPDFVQRIPFWIRLRGLPIHMLKNEVVESMLGPLGKVELVELHAKHSNSLEYIRAFVHISTEEPLQFRRISRFKTGATIPTELEYEKLIRIRFLCKRLTHDQSRCPLQIQSSHDEVREKQEMSNELNLRIKLMEKEHKAKEALHKKAVSGAVARKIPIGANQRGGRNISQDSSKEDKRKGKHVASTPQLVWKQKGERGGSRLSHSTEESTATPRSSGERYGSGFEKNVKAGKGRSETIMETVLVFNCLGSQEDMQDAEDSGGRSSLRRLGGDLRSRLSGGSHEEKLEAKSSKGSRSPPIVFERLGGQMQSTPRGGSIVGFLVSKRR